MTTTLTSLSGVILNALNIIIVTFVLMISVVISVGMIIGLKPDVVVTNSMEPNIPVNSLVIVMPVEWDTIEVGDHISYYRNENGNIINYIHRVEAKGTDYLIMKGENPNIAAFSHTVSKDAVQGKELFVMPGVGGVFVWVKANAILTFMILFTIVIGLLLIRKVIDINHVNVAFAEYIKRRVDFEQQMKIRADEESKSSRVKTLDKLLNRNY